MAVEKHINLPKQFSLQYKYLYAQKILSKNKQYNFNEHESDWTIP